MIYGIGIDLIELERIAKIIKRKEQDFINKILTNKEMAICPNNLRRKVEFIAGRFAGKEAVAKSFGTGIGNHLGWKNIEILSTDLGKPYVKLVGDVNFPKDLVVHISIAHTKDLAIAKVIVEQI